jgi:hypothetical protein
MLGQVRPGSGKIYLIVRIDEVKSVYVSLSPVSSSYFRLCQGS